MQAVPLLHQTRRLKTGVAKSSGVVAKSSGVVAKSSGVVVKGSGVVVKRAAACVFPSQPKLPAISSQTTATGVVHVTDARDKGESSGYQYSRDPDNIDEKDANDELMVTAYVKEMFQFFREREQVIYSYLGGDDAIQPIINERMRSILVDWLVEVHLGMRCDPAVLYLAIQIIDRFLAAKSPSNKATKKNLQLIGTSAFFIASKYEQIYPVSLRDLEYVCDHVYTEDDVSFLLVYFDIALYQVASSYIFFLLYYIILQIISMETVILNTLKYQISLPTAHTFLVRYLNAAHTYRELTFLTQFILETSLYSYELVTKYSPSQLAAAAVLIGRKAVGRNSWSPTLLKYTEYREEDIKPIARVMLAEKKSLRSSLTAVKQKYHLEKYLKVAGVMLPSESEL